MMSRRFVAIAFAAMMLATAIVSLNPVVTAQDTVPTKPTVPMVPLPNVEQRLYLRYLDRSTGSAGTPVDGTTAPQPDCDATGIFALGPVPNPTDFGGRPSCRYPLLGGDNAAASPVAFQTDATLTPRRGINFTGNDTFHYVHSGEIPAGVTVAIELRQGGVDGTLVASGVIEGESEDALLGQGAPVDSFAAELELRGEAGDRGRGFLQPNSPLVIILIPSVDADEVSPLGSWSVRDGGAGSYLSVRAHDALRAATWVTDERDEVKDVFTPIAANSTRLQDEDRRIVGHFALQSAFGYEDASTGPLPEFQIFHGGLPREVGPDGDTIIESFLNLSASAPTEGLAVWSFEPGFVNYRGMPAGDYLVRVDADLHTGASLPLGTEKRFAITAQSVQLFPFFDSRLPGVTESLAHTVQPGGTTTYLLAVNNTGNVNDTFTINVTASNAPTGWGAGEVGGPHVLGRRLFVPANETRLFTVTVSAPFAQAGSAIHLVNVTSTLDPGVRSQLVTLVSTIGTETIRDVSIVFLQKDLAIEPGIEHVFPVYVWNRGTRVANASLEVQGTISPAWRAQLVFGNAGVGRMVVNGIQPGDIGEAQLRVVGPVSQTPDRQPIRLNATSLDVQGVSRDLDLAFTLRSLAGVRVQVLDVVNGLGHVVEVTQANSTSCQLGEITQDPCTDDGVNGIWFRTWVTNTGRARDTFRLTGDTFDKSSGSTSTGAPCTSTVFIPGTDANAMDNEEFGFFFRGPSGEAGGQDQLTLEPGETGELYAFLPIDEGAELCFDDDRDEDFYSFIIQAASTTGSGAIGRAPVEAVARDSGNRQAGVYLEPVARRDGYSSGSPRVDLGNITTRLVTGGAEPGQTVRYYVRATSLASWAEFTTDDGTSRPVVNVSVIGTESEPEWNVSIRPVLSNANDANYDEVNPFRRSLEFGNLNGAYGDGRDEAWFDREIEVRVETPRNGTASTGAKLEFQLLATVAGRDSRSTLELTTIVTDKAQVNVTATPTRALAHPGEAGAFLLTLSNVGGSATDVTLQAAMSPTTPNAALWQVSPNAQTFNIAAFTNRTVALLVTPPPGAAQGQSGELSVNITYFDHPTTLPNSTARSIVPPLAVDVVAPGTLQLTTPTTDVTVPPGGTANFTMTVRNTGSLDVPFRVAATPIPNWTVTASPATGNLRPGENRTVVLVAIAPPDVKNDTRFSTVLTVTEDGATNNFDSAAFNVNILGGKALPRISVPTLVKRVDRAGVQTFEVGIQNVGTAAGRLPLEVRSADPSWTVGLVDQRGSNITGAQLGPNELQFVNVTVRAPFSVPERTSVPIEIIAYSQDLTQAAKSTLTAEVHDYGVQLELLPASKEGLPGTPTEFIARVRNTGNDNDTLNISVNLVELPEWIVNLSMEETPRLEPGQSVDVRATILSPRTPLPAARAYTFPFWVGTRGGQDVDLAKNMTVGAIVTIPNYRAHDVDRDGQLEVTVDLDRRAANGFEEFREVFPEGLSTQVVADPLFEGRTTYFLDIPRDRPYDGVADVWFNPETVHAFEIEHAPDVNGDGTPDYLLDTNRDGKLDKAFDSSTERFWDVTEIKVFGDDRIQYLIDTTGDGRPDRFYDPETRRVTRTQNADDVGADLVGIDVDDDDTVDYYYNTRTQETSGAEVQNVGSFAKQYWYFFVVFAALVLLTVMLLVRRRKMG